MVRAGIYKMRKNSTTVYFCRPLSLVSFKHKESLPASLLFTMLFVCLFACLFGCFIWYSYPQVIENLFLNSPPHPAHLFVCLFVCFVLYGICIPLKIIFRSPLHLAAAAGHLPCLYHLVAHAAFINCLVRTNSFIRSARHIIIEDDGHISVKKP